METRRIQEITEEARKRYSGRLNQHGFEPRALGWGSEAHQRTRFAAAASLIDGRNLIDLGCGFGDLFGYLKETNRRPDRYHGIDILPDFVREGARRYGDEKGVSFSEGNIFEGRPAQGADTVVALGLLNYRLASEEENYAYVHRFLKESLAVAGRCVIFDGISKYRAPQYPEESFIFYADPSRILEIVAGFSTDFALLHDLPLIPQREYVVCVRKQGSPKYV